MNKVTMIVQDDGTVLVEGVIHEIALHNGDRKGLEIDSVETARAIAHAILDADRHALEAPALARVEIIDVGEHARALYGGQEGADAVAGRPVPKHDYRFRGLPGQPCAGTGYGRHVTAAHIMAYIERDRELKAKGL